jgi:SAM-dependent methyltransferase
MSSIQWAKINSFAGNNTSKSLGYHRPCPICGSLDARAILELNDFQFYSDSKREPKRFDVHENMCLNCSALYLNPCYSNYGFSVLFAEAGQSYGSTSEHTDEQIEWLSTHDLLGDGARLLDVGCFDGYFLSCLPSNVKKLGVDIDEPAINRGRQKYAEKDIQFYLGDFETFPYSGSAPDTITMFHVLEHLPRPVEVLRKLRSIAEESTRLVVEVPILENGKTNDINGFFSIQHTTHFSSNSLRNCLALAGWKVEKQYQTKDYNGCRILASPQLEARTDYPLNFVPEDCIDLNDNIAGWYRAIGSVENVIKKIPNCDRFVIWGGGAHTEFLYQTTSLFHTHRQKEFVIIDSDSIKHGHTWRGIPIFDPSIIMELDWSSTNLLVSSYGGQESIIEHANKLNVPASNIIRFYETVIRY